MTPTAGVRRREVGRRVIDERYDAISTAPIEYS
jgi:hypothetical protein